MDTFAPPSGTDKIWSILCHISPYMGLPFLLPFAVYLGMKNDSQYVAENARESLNFHISVFIYSLCCIPLLFIVIGIPCLGALWVIALIFAVIATIKASEGNCYRYPLTLRLV